MRERFLVSAFAALLATVALASIPSCWPFTEGADCATAFIGCPVTDGGPDDGPSPSCTPSLNSAPVADSCGVFVSPEGDDGNAGNMKDKPLKTLTAALSKGSTIYACAGATPFSEALMVNMPVTLFGALDCTTWAYDAGNKTQLTAAADTVPLSLTSAASGTQVNDFVITAADAMTAGASSIAVLDNGADLTLGNVEVDAGAGKDGIAGPAQSQVSTPTSANGSNGTSDGTCMNTGNILGGPGGTNACNSTPTNGGNGGRGTPLSVGEPGVDGQPMTPANGGAGQTTTPCQPGGIGNAATAGAAAAGTPGTGAHGIGDVSASGYQAPVATLGGVGSVGQGGGGGGGAHACDVNDMYAGPSGGGGGAGGCGGMPGNPGASGGSSIGILALNAKLSLTTVVITTKAGGAGGIGGAAQLGGIGGQQGNQGGAGACPGGIGGQGGAGGPGGGGAGGHSVAIASKGATLPDLSSTTITYGSGGMGGAGGDMTVQTKGDAGLGCKTLDFTNPASPTACAP